MPAVPLLGRGVKLLSVPPVTTMSPGAKVVLASDKVKVMVSLLLSVPVPLRAMAMVGGVVSAGMVLVGSLTVLLLSAPSWL